MHITTVRHAELTLETLATVRVILETIQKNRASFPNLPLINEQADSHIVAAMNIIRSQEIKPPLY